MTVFEFKKHLMEQPSYSCLDAYDREKLESGELDHQLGILLEHMSPLEASAFYYTFKGNMPEIVITMTG